MVTQIIEWRFWPEATGEMTPIEETVLPVLSLGAAVAAGRAYHCAATRR